MEPKCAHLGFLKKLQSSDLFCFDVSNIKTCLSVTIDISCQNIVGIHGKSKICVTLNAPMKSALVSSDKYQVQS